VGIKLLQLYVIIERYIEMRRGKKKEERGRRIENICGIVM
jgi:hypothetical protein